VLATTASAGTGEPVEGNAASDGGGETGAQVGYNCEYGVDDVQFIIIHVLPRLFSLISWE
jgi:hypothetical protein